MKKLLWAVLALSLLFPIQGLTKKYKKQKAKVVTMAKANLSLEEKKAFLMGSLINNSKDMLHALYIVDGRVSKNDFKALANFVKKHKVDLKKTLPTARVEGASVYFNSEKAVTFKKNGRIIISGYGFNPPKENQADLWFAEVEKKLGLKTKSAGLMGLLVPRAEALPLPVILWGATLALPIVSLGGALAIKKLKEGFSGKRGKKTRTRKCKKGEFETPFASYLGSDYTIDSSGDLSFGDDYMSVAAGAGCFPEINKKLDFGRSSRGTN